MQDYDYTSDNLTDARIDGWNDCKALILFELNRNIKTILNNNNIPIKIIDLSIIKEIEKEDFGTIAVA